MNSNSHFSLTRFAAIVIKEFVQMRRDRLTFGMMVGIPILQLVLFGFAINSDPKNLPAAVRSPRWPSRASASVAPWKTSSPCPHVRWR